MPLAYSYLRFSSPQQAAGDSIRRQAEAREKWLAAHPDVRLDTSLKLSDEGRSGYRRKDWDTYALAQFVALIKSGSVPKGSYLLVENLDRLSREEVGEATELFLSIVNKGITIVQLEPTTIPFAKPVDMMKLMYAIMELSRGHSQSAEKSHRVGKAWAQKQRDAAAGKIVTKRTPLWIKAVDGKLVLDAPKAAVVRRIFADAIAGSGGMTIAKALNAEKVPVLGRAVMKGRAVAWSNVQVNHILTSRAAIGEYVPYKTDRTKTPGTPVPGYFPAVVDERTYYAAQAALKTRAAVGRGRRGKFVNLFAGVLVDARDGGGLTYRHQKPHTVLGPINPARDRGNWTTFPADIFERAVLRRLREVRATDIVGDNNKAREVEELLGRKGELEALVRAWEAKMGNLAIVDTVAENLAKFKSQLREVDERLAAAQSDAASPVTESLTNLHTLADVLDRDNSDAVRLKVRAALRRCVESVACLFVGTTHNRIAAVRIQFRDSQIHRDYILSVTYTSGKVRRAEVSVKSFAEAGAGELDLRDPKQAARFEADLTRAVKKVRAKD